MSVTAPKDATTTQTVRESARVSTLSLVLGYGATVPVVLGAVGLWFADGQVAGAVVDGVILWSAIILAFLAGVRRGLSFRTPGGPTLMQMAVMGGLFAVALAAFVLPWDRPVLILLILAYASLAVLDPWAASRGEAPLFFTRLRPIQMPIFALALAVCLAGAPG